TDTARLFATARAGVEASQGRFDPTLLADLVRAGYDRPFERLVPAGGVETEPRPAPGTGAPGGRGEPGRGEWRARARGIETIGRAGRHAVRLPAGVGFDPGGIGKGLAADMVVEELFARGAHGACVNVGGDVRVRGEAPDGG